MITRYPMMIAWKKLSFGLNEDPLRIEWMKALHLIDDCWCDFSLYQSSIHSFFYRNFFLYSTITAFVEIFNATLVLVHSARLACAFWFLLNDSLYQPDNCIMTNTQHNFDRDFSFLFRNFRNSLDFLRGLQ